MEKIIPALTTNQHNRPRNSRLLDLEEEMKLALESYEWSEVSFQKKLTARLRTELIENISTLQMTEDRKSYYIHQLAYCRSLEEIILLVREMNEKQLDAAQDLIFLKKSSSGLVWLRQ